MSAWKLFLRFKSYAVPYRMLLVKATVCFLIASVLISLVPLGMKFLIDVAIPEKNVTLLLILAGAVLLVSGGKNIILYFGTNTLTYAGMRMVLDIRRRLFDHLQSLHLGYYQSQPSGKLTYRVINDVMMLQRLISQGVSVIGFSLLSLLISLGIMFFLSWQLTIVALIVCPLYAVVHVTYRRHIRLKSREVRELNSVFAGKLTETITGAKVVKAFAQEQRERMSFFKQVREILIPELDLSYVGQKRNRVLDQMTQIGTALCMIIGGLLVIFRPEQLTLGGFIAMMGYIGMLYGPMMQIAQLGFLVINAHTGLERVADLLDIVPEIVDAPDAHSVDHLDGSIELENVTFAYEENLNVVEDISIKIKPGEVVAFVGSSGSGKTTMINLIARFMDVTSGRILIDGEDIKNLKVRDFRSQLGIVSQDSFIFSGSIRENICYGRPDASEEDIIDAARQANALEFIDERPEGFQTLVGENGVSLSGGQRQRIAIARAILKDPKILILDEATSALDNESERIVQEALDRLMVGRTVFVVAHRLSTIHSTDRIYAMKDGRIVEQGTHSDLMSNNGLYKHLYNLGQSKKKAA